VASKKSSARKARAQQLRAEIARLTKKPPVPPSKPESPAAFVHRRMAELAAQEKQRSKSRRASQ
jgi:hypothetical protein